VTDLHGLGRIETDLHHAIWQEIAGNGLTILPTRRCPCRKLTPWKAPIDPAPWTEQSRQVQSATTSALRT